uniref:Nucleoporin Nup133/Nup155-like C-terminal domain-containing protein n=1 Tax=Panagrolaimus superbus TaxID=310955 RepID=A0A914YF77_9BILA
MHFIHIFQGLIVANLWNTRICRRQNNLAFNALPMEEVENVIQYTGALLAAIKRYNLLTYNSESKIFDQENVRAYDAELRSLQEYERMVTNTHEFLNLWRILDEHQFHVLTQLLPDDVFSGLGNVTFAQAILTCKETSAEFVTAIVKHYIGDEATTAVISQRLTEECPSLFTSQDAHILKASEHIAIAKSLPLGHERQRAIQTAVDFLRKCVQRVNMGLICDLLKQINAYDAIADLALQRAFNEDPSKIAVIAYRESISQIDSKVRDAVAKRGECYRHIDNALDYLQQQITNGNGGEISVPLALSQRDAILQRVLESDDELAHINLFQWMLKNGMEDRLLKRQQRFFEQFLMHEIREGGGEYYLKLLWRYYEKNENYVSAAKLLLDFAENSPKIDLKGRMTYLSHALLCIQSATETRQNQELKQRVQEFLDVTQIQQQTYDEIAKIGGVKISDNEAKDALEQLNSKLFSLTELFSSFADQYNLPTIKLGIVKCANHYDPDTIEDIWKEILKQEYENCNDATTLRARLTATLSKLYRLYGVSQHYVPVEFIIRELLLKGSRLSDNASWLPSICKDSGISLAALLHHVQNEFRQDPFWHEPRQLQYIINMGKCVIEDFLNEQNKMNHSDRSVLKDKCLSFIGTLQLNIQEMHGMQSPVDALKMYEEELKLI